VLLLQLLLQGGNCLVECVEAGLPSTRFMERASNCLV
jgi:hypothetical protein